MDFYSKFCEFWPAILLMYSAQHYDGHICFLQKPLVIIVFWTQIMMYSPKNILKCNIYNVRALQKPLIA